MCVLAPQWFRLFVTLAGFLVIASPSYSQSPYVDDLLGACKIAGNFDEQYAAGSKLVKNFKLLEELRKNGQLTKRQLMEIAVEKKRFFMRVMEKTARRMSSKKRIFGGKPLHVIINETGSHIGLEHGFQEGFRAGGPNLKPSDYDFNIVGDDANKFVNEVRQTIKNDIGSINPDADLGFAVSTIDGSAINQIDEAYDPNAFDLIRIRDTIKGGSCALVDPKTSKIAWNIKRAAPHYAKYTMSLDDTIDAAKFFDNKMGRLVTESDAIARSKLGQRALFAKDNILKLTTEERLLQAEFELFKAGSGTDDALKGRIAKFRAVAEQLENCPDGTADILLKNMTHKERAIAKRLQKQGTNMTDDVIRKAAFEEFSDDASRIVKNVSEDLTKYKWFSKTMAKTKTGGKLLKIMRGMAVPMATVVIGYSTDGWKAAAGAGIEALAEAIKPGSTTPAALAHIGKLAVELTGQIFLDDLTDTKVKADLKSIFGGDKGGIDAAKLQEFKSSEELQKYIGKHVRDGARRYSHWAANVIKKGNTFTGSPRGSEEYCKLVEKKVLEGILPIWHKVRAVIVADEAIENCGDAELAIYDFVDREVAKGNIENNDTIAFKLKHDLKYEFAVHQRRKRIAYKKALLEHSEKIAKQVEKEAIIARAKELRREEWDREQASENDWKKSRLAKLEQALAAQDNDDPDADRSYDRRVSSTDNEEDEERRKLRFWRVGEAQRQQALEEAEARRKKRIAQLEQELLQRVQRVSGDGAPMGLAEIEYQLEREIASERAQARNEANAAVYDADQSEVYNPARPQRPTKPRDYSQPSGGSSTFGLQSLLEALRRGEAWARREIEQDRDRYRPGNNSSGNPWVRQALEDLNQEFVASQQSRPPQWGAASSSSYGSSGHSSSSSSRPSSSGGGQKKYIRVELLKRGRFKLSSRTDDGKPYYHYRNVYCDKTKGTYWMTTGTYHIGGKINPLPTKPTFVTRFFTYQEYAKLVERVGNSNRGKVPRGLLSSGRIAEGIKIIRK